jgi:putative heme-binding domain-containing protein
MTSVTDDELGPLLKVVLAHPQNLPAGLVNRLMEFAGSAKSAATVATAVDLAADQADHAKPQQFAALESFLAGLRRNPQMTNALSKDSTDRLRQVCQKCVRLAADPDVDLATRAVCIRVVGRAPQSILSNLNVLSGFLTPDHDLKLQLAAIDALADGTQDEVAGELLKGWPAFTPSLRSRVLDVLVSRKVWARALLDAVNAKSFASTNIDAAHRARLIEYPDEDLRQLAATSLAATSTGNRAEVVDRYTKSLPAGDAARGQAVFKKNCIPCHEFHGVGNKVGPDIAALKDKTNDGLLREILDPNRAVDQRFAEYVAITTDGRVKNGILVDETSNAITLRGQQAEQTSLLRSEIDSLSSTGKSLMPEGFENQITPQDMADLLVFLASP